MKERDRAASILQRARDVLAERLTQRILDCEQEILDDAEGQSYLSEIEAVYEQLGGRLAHVNTMLSNLPPSEEPSGDEAELDSMASDPIYTDMGSSYPTAVDAAMAVHSATLALPPPAIGEERPQLTAAGATLQGFAVQMQNGDLESGTRSLCELFCLDVVRGRLCAETFADKLALETDIVLKVIRLRSELAGGSVNNALTLLWDCFGLSGLESLGALQSLKLRLGVAGESAVR